MNPRTIWLMEHALPLLAERVRSLTTLHAQAEEAERVAVRAESEARNRLWCAEGAYAHLRSHLVAEGCSAAELDAASARGMTPPDAPPLCQCGGEGGGT